MAAPDCKKVYDGYMAEYFTPRSDETRESKTYYITVKSPEDIRTRASIENTPESEHWSGEHRTDPATPIRKIYPSRTFLEDSLTMSSSYTLTPDKDAEFFSPERSLGQDWSRIQDSGKRGRPRADVINSLIMEGSQSGSNIKCKICSRVFPREKSLQAHLRTHTGEKPYNCDYPNCTRAFTQSGQLKTHQRLHAGEKPFVCSHSGCNNRYTHANRQCPEHPFAKPQRSAEIILQPNISSTEDKSQVLVWLEKYKREKEEKTPGKFNPNEALGSHEENLSEEIPEFKRNRSKRGLAEEMEQCLDQENQPSSNQRAMAAKQTLNQALQRAGERLEQRISQPFSRREDDTKYVSQSFLPERRLTLSPGKKSSLEHHSPLKGIRRTLGDITPTKNCRSDQFHSELDLPFNFGLPTSPAFSSEMLLRTPISTEKCLSSPIHGSPALKLKKRFQERFQEEKLIEREELAKPIIWQEQEQEEFTSPQKREFSSPLSYEFSSPSRDTNSPTLLVAAALVELQDRSREDIPLNLTKYK
jgi:hypothetical protein